jgi:hypothetical protein
VEFALDLFILFCWGIWMVRNDVVFRNRNPDLQECRRYVTEKPSSYCIGSRID